MELKKLLIKEFFPVCAILSILAEMDHSKDLTTHPELFLSYCDLEKKLLTDLISACCFIFS